MEFVNRVLQTQGQVAAPATSKADLLNLLGKLHPELGNTPLIRMGGDQDGGYLVPDDMNGIAACFSPGVSSVSDFEMACTKRDIPVYLADFSVDGPALESPDFHFRKKYIGALNNDTFTTLDSWISESHPDSSSDLLLQMDIEGFEYESLLSLSPSNLNRFRIIVVEFHSLDRLGILDFFRLFERTIDKLLIDHVCVHIHPNNFLPPVYYHGIALPPLLEMTFHRRDRHTATGHAKSFPHPLDRDNTGKAHFALPSDWYQSRPKESLR